MEKHEYKELQELAANGGMKYFGKLYETIYRQMYYTAFYTLRDDADTVDVITETVRSGFRAIGRLHSEAAFRLYMMRQLCSGIKAKFKQYSSSPDDGNAVSIRPNINSDGIDIKREFSSLPDTERLVFALYVGGKFRAEEIVQFTGLSLATVKKKLDRALTAFELD